MKIRFWLWIVVAILSTTSTVGSVRCALADANLPIGVHAVWDLEKAHHDTTPTRTRIDQWPVAMAAGGHES